MAEDNQTLKTEAGRRADRPARSHRAGADEGPKAGKQSACRHPGEYRTTVETISRGRRSRVEKCERCGRGRRPGKDKWSVPAFSECAGCGKPYIRNRRNPNADCWKCQQKKGEEERAQIQAALRLTERLRQEAAIEQQMQQRAEQKRAERIARSGMCQERLINQACPRCGNTGAAVDEEGWATCVMCARIIGVRKEPPPAIAA